MLASWERVAFEYAVYWNGLGGSKEYGRLRSLRLYKRSRGTQSRATDDFQSIAYGGMKGRHTTASAISQGVGRLQA